MHQPSSIHRQCSCLPAQLRLVPLGLAAAAAVLLGAPHHAAAYNVRLQDVESPTLQAGLRAATEGRLNDAERFFKIYLLDEPDSASGWSNLGNVHQQQGQAQQAVEDYSKAVALAPEAPVPYLNRAISKEALGVQAAASGDSSRALDLWQSAAADCDRAIELDPKEYAAWFDRGNIDLRLQDYAAALTDFGTAADLAPGLGGYRLRQATLMFQQGDVDGARRTMQGVTRKYSNYAEAHAALAAVEWSRGDAERAEQQFYRAVAQDERWNNMGWILENTRWPPKLESAMQRFLSMGG